jgi:drug/metabolite transporter (DMT)-like permease
MLIRKIADFKPGGGMLRVIIAMTIATASAALGQILLRRGMLQVGSLETYAPWPLAVYFWHALCNPYVIFGTILNGAFYFLFMAALSWTDVTIALPMTAIEYAFAAVLAIALLKETVTPIRWIGITMVIIGVVLIARGGGET